MRANESYVLGIRKYLRKMGRGIRFQQQSLYISTFGYFRGRKRRKREWKKKRIAERSTRSSFRLRWQKDWHTCLRRKRAKNIRSNGNCYLQFNRFGSIQIHLTVCCPLVIREIRVDQKYHRSIPLFDKQRQYIRDFEELGLGTLSSTLARVSNEGDSFYFSSERK